MEQLDKSDVNRNRRRNNIDQFAPLYESDNEEGTHNGTKSKNPIIVLREKEKGSKKIGGQNKSNE